MKSFKLSLVLLTAIFALQTFTTDAFFGNAFARFAAFGKSRLSLFKMQKPLRRTFNTEVSKKSEDELTWGEAVVSGAGLGIIGLIALGCIESHYAEKDRAYFLKAAETGNVQEVQRLARYEIVQDQYKNNAMHLAARNGHLDIVQLLDKRGKGWNYRNNIERTPIHEAAASCHSPIVNYFKTQYKKQDSQSYGYATTADSMGKTPDDYLAQCSKS